jgi:hypothetical protein
MELTWVPIAASLSMGLGAACLFVFALRKDWFRNLEDAKYQVFWSDAEPLADSAPEKRTNGSHPKKSSSTNSE